MYCPECGLSLDKNCKFCHHCGVNIGADLLIPQKVKKTKQIGRANVNVDKTRETVEEYQARTNIKSKEEAKKYLKQLRVLFWIVFLSIIAMRGLSESESELAVMLVIPYIGLLVYFIIFSVKVLEAEKLSGANALWWIFFAPISWLYIYPLMADPLKIILGEKQPPIRLSETERKQKSVQANKKFWRNFWVITGTLFGIFVVSLIIVILLT